MTREHYGKVDAERQNYARPMGPHEFLQSEDLEALKEKPLLAEKTRNFQDYLACIAATATVASCGMNVCIAPAQFCCGAMLSGAYLQITDQQVEFSQPTPSCCVLARTKRTVRYENVTDVTIEDDCCLQMFQLKKLVIQTAGTGGGGDGVVAGVQAAFLKDPDAWKEAINHAVQLHKGLAAPGAQGMSRDAVPKVAKRQKMQLDRIAELARLRIVTEAQADEMRTGGLLKDEDYGLQLLGMYSLVQQGHLSEQHLQSAVQLVLQKIRQ